MRNPLRVFWRSFWLASELGGAACAYARLMVTGAVTASKRARWLQISCRRVLKVFNVNFVTSGAAPESGLLVCNHLSYLDILLLGAMTPCVFVAKSEVRHWPMLGWFARRAGCLFVNREKRGDVARINQQIQQALDQQVVVVLFPEGTSSDGQSVLPFRSSLLQPAVQGNHNLTVGRLSYGLNDGKVEDEVCYWRDMTLMPHLLNLLSKRRVEAAVNFSSIRELSVNRKTLAIRLHAEVSRLGTIANPVPPPRDVIGASPEVVAPYIPAGKAVSID